VKKLPALPPSLHLFLTVHARVVVRAAAILARRMAMEMSDDEDEDDGDDGEWDDGGDADWDD
jgi:hypothetical protein